MRLLLAIFFCSFWISAPADAEDVRVGLEPGPPLVNADGTGPLISVLHSLEKFSDLRFHITVMPYNRAVKELKMGRRDLIFPTRYQGETDEFNSFAEELHWSVVAILDVYSMKPITGLDIYREKNRKVGTPRGSEIPMSQRTGIPLQNFVGGEIDGLLLMLKAGRIDAFMFARAPTMSAVQRLDMGIVYYRKLFQGSGGFGVRRDAAGKKLKGKLDPMLAQVDNAPFAEFQAYHLLPDSGQVPPKKP